ncbi:MAG: hypothetical protein KAX37_01510 [Opitutaceae bacterium]|jgi:hypothetical protein|nr:hypothetical protein [Opitutaceae bacterium]
MKSPDAKAGDQTALVNLAFRVKDLSEVERFVESTDGWRKNALHDIGGDIFLEASFGGVRVNFFHSALYDDAQTTTAPGFLHASYNVAKLDDMLANEAWAKALVWGPSVISGGFGHRRIAFFEPLPGCRIELMEDLA